MIVEVFRCPREQNENHPGPSVEFRTEQRGALVNSCLPAQGVHTGCVSGEEAWLVLTDDSSCEMVLASGAPIACLLLVKVGSDVNGAGRDFGIRELECAQGPIACMH